MRKRTVSEERLNNPVKCEVCGMLCKNYISLAKHLKYHHSLSSEAYYNQYLRKDGEGLCPVCGGKTRFVNLSVGYKKEKR